MALPTLEQVYVTVDANQDYSYAAIPLQENVSHQNQIIVEWRVTEVTRLSDGVTIQLEALSSSVRESIQRLSSTMFSFDDVNRDVTLDPSAISGAQVVGSDLITYVLPTFGVSALTPVAVLRSTNIDNRLPFTPGSRLTADLLNQNVDQVFNSVQELIVNGRARNEGPAGPQGAPGSQGAPGTNGTNGVDGVDGQDGDDGQDGAGFSGGSYNSSNGIITFTSNDGLGFATTDVRGTDGIDGPDVTLSADAPDQNWVDTHNQGDFYVQFDVDSILTANDLADVDTTGITDGQVLVYDAATTSFIPGVSGEVDEAPTDGAKYARQNSAWTTITDGQDGTNGTGFTSGSYNAATGVVTFTSDDGLGFTTSDLRGADGQDGQDGTNGTNGTNGTPGANGQGWTGGSYDAATGIVSFTSNDGLEFNTTDLRGADGQDGQDGAANDILVQDFGAVGDGTTDDTSAILSALTAGSTQEKNVIFESGRTYLTDPIVIEGTSGICPPAILGYDVVLKARSGSTPLVTLKNIFASAAWKSGFEFRGFTLDCANTLSTGLLVEGAQHTLVQDVHVYDTASGSYAIRVIGGPGAGIYYNSFNRCTAGKPANPNRGGGWEVATDDAAPDGNYVGNNTFTACNAQANEGHGWRINWSQNTYVGCNAERNNGYGWDIDVSYSNTFSGGYSENNHKNMATSTTDGTQDESFNLTSDSLGVKILGGRHVGHIVGTTTGQGNVFMPDTYTQFTPMNLDADGTLITNDIFVRDGSGIGLGGTNGFDNGINFGNGGVLSANGTTVAQLTTDAFKSYKPISVENTAARIYSASGTPEGSQAAAAGSVYMDTSGGVYVKETGTGTTGWASLSTGATTDTNWLQAHIQAGSTAITNADGAVLFGGSSLPILGSNTFGNNTSDFSSGVYTVPRAGLYTVTLSLNPGTNADRLYGRVRKNSTNYGAPVFSYAIGGDGSQFNNGSMTFIIDASAGDTIDAVIQSGSATSTPYTVQLTIKEG